MEIIGTICGQPVEYAAAPGIVLDIIQMFAYESIKRLVLKIVKEIARKEKPKKPVTVFLLLCYPQVGRYAFSISINNKEYLVAVDCRKVQVWRLKPDKKLSKRISELLILES